MTTAVLKLEIILMGSESKAEYRASRSFHIFIIIDPTENKTSTSDQFIQTPPPECSSSRDILSSPCLSTPSTSSKFFKNVAFVRGFYVDNPLLKLLLKTVGRSDSS